MKSSFSKDAYLVLGLQPGASLDQIKAAYAASSKVWNPTNFKDDPELQDRAKHQIEEVDKAYATLLLEFRAEPTPDETLDLSSTDVSLQQKEVSSPLKNPTADSSEKSQGTISSRPLKFLFFFFGVWLGGGLAKLLTAELIRFPQVTNPNTAGNVAWLVTGIVVVFSAWANSKIGARAADKLNSSAKTKKAKTAFAWAFGILSFIVYMFFAGFFYSQAISVEFKNQNRLAADVQQQSQPAFSIDPAAPDSASSENDIAQRYVDIQDWEGLRQFALKLTEQAPRTASGWNYLSLSYMKMGKYYDGIKAADQALAVDRTSKESAESFNLRGLCLGLTGDKKRAVDDLQTAIQRDPFDPVIYYNLAQFQMSMQGLFDQTLGETNLLIACKKGYQRACEEAREFQAVMNNHR